ncbi:hypothetical protein P3T35_000504 [Kitasatospora sp. GP30]|uniref:hypothetical protein n=1 Tax=Kitasatospora sp. GP30 TaxID=3035084 RepID=UPI000CAD9A5E|nr:hypothetical protein [Kitasatospora sp. GP30]MDH6138527.1 hypothetical protein [Kitasatospora sp. GP30]
MPKYLVPIDVITVHLVPVLAPTREAAQAEAERIVTGDWETWFDHAEPLVVGDAQTEAEWDTEQEAISRTGNSGMPGPLRARRPKATHAPRFIAPRTDHHGDGTPCPPEHKHTSSGRPLAEGCSGRAYSEAVCTCGGWSIKSSGKGHVDEERRRHLRTAH